mmetsp:Transcript_129762/g.361499  ORF Transcript_129762/g.361499 Transcript_129762/m.361499 type:complete len:434 (+) Transcript_129762:14-1315(+)
MPQSIAPAMESHHPLSHVAAPLLSRLDAPELCRLMPSCKMWQAWNGVVSGCWANLLDRDFCQSASSCSSSSRKYLMLAGPPCNRCRRLFWVSRRGSWRRCLCVAWRGVRPPLTVVSLSFARCGDGSFCEWEGHTAARAAAAALFNVQFIAIEELSDAALVQADLLVVHTTSARVPLSAQEQGSLARFCEGGGTVLLNCFSQWTLNGGHGREPVAFLGVEPVRGAPFGRSRAARLCMTPDAPSADLCLAGPWGSQLLYGTWLVVQDARDGTILGDDPAAEGLGAVEGHAAQVLDDELDAEFDPDAQPMFDNDAEHAQDEAAGGGAGDIDFYVTAADDVVSFRFRGGEFVNHGETVFDAARPLASGAAVQLCVPTRPQACCGPLWFPTVAGAGQAMVCSNLHWLANPEAWNGGLVRQTGNTVLWLNLCAAACRSL